MTKKVPAEFDDIRSLYDEEVAPAVAQLVQSSQLQELLVPLMGQENAAKFLQGSGAAHSIDEFQRSFILVLLQALESKTCKEVTLEGTENIDRSCGHMYISNHRDIVLDAALLNMHLYLQGHETTQIGIGNNLLAAPWIEYAMRLNKSYIVRRDGSVKEQLLISKHLAEYIRQVVEVNGDGLWIAQREGRAKDGNDRTQSSVLKMIGMAGEGDLVTKLRARHILPVSITYEYDPCDYLKAREMQLKRDNAEYKKAPGEDVLSMKTGLMGFKGRVSFVISPELAISSDMEALPRNQQADAIASLLDQSIHRGYRLFANNYIAADLVAGNNAFADRYTADEKAQFLGYITQQIARIDIPNKDEAFLRERMLEMYANPALNQRAAAGQG